MVRCWFVRANREHATQFEQCAKVEPMLRWEWHTTIDRSGVLFYSYRCFPDTRHTTTPWSSPSHHTFSLSKNKTEEMQGTALRKWKLTGRTSRYGCVSGIRETCVATEKLTAQELFQWKIPSSHCGLYFPIVEHKLASCVVSALQEFLAGRNSKEGCVDVAWPWGYFLTTSSTNINTNNAYKNEKT